MLEISGNSVLPRFNFTQKIMSLDVLSFAFKKVVVLNIENKSKVDYEYWLWVKDHEDLQYNQINILNHINKIYKEDVNEIQLEIVSNKLG